MDLDGYLTEVQRGTGLILDAASGGLDRRVPSCPEWSMADLVAHVGVFYAMWVEVATTPDFDPKASERPARVADDELIDWFRAMASSCIDAVREVGDLDAPLWNWSGRDETLGWIARRMAEEVAIHAWDADGAVGAPGPVPAPVAIEGVDEFFDVFAPLFAPGLEFPDTTVHLHATDDLEGDRSGEWLIRAATGSIECEHGHAKGDVAVRAPASDLFLMCWGRKEPGALEVFGDGDRATALLRAMRI
jgi:uncharacterized protein (TIGR03083 family)